MIEKLDKFDSTEASIYHAERLYAKVNQLIDAVNKHEDIIRQIGEWGSSKDECLWCENLTEVNLGAKSRPENVQDKFAEQRRWIGKLCWFSNGDGFDEVGYLTEIDPDMPEEKFQCDCHDYYKECKPVKPTDSIIYKGGDNDE